MSLLEEVRGAIQPPDGEAMAKARERLDILAKPRGSLGVLEEIAVALAGIDIDVGRLVGAEIPRARVIPGEGVRGGFRPRRFHAGE
ncbi:MAG: nicotinate-nucleotide--dimethylbenzimidazole phosphoribosyltransferase [Firmicutes bacterium]|nr:nicotinate-nucleotide--dimethylbenzimidazole phosphoribosyltransferase [Bacillota bacterium]MCL5040740.1 nicotinate-nucleotide--dimethylbenzimidazole phosphoribosyltransferase [Bacillota bacterium]